MAVMAQSLYYDKTIVFYGQARIWVDPAYRIVTFHEAPSGDMLTWLQNNAVKATGGTWVLNDNLGTIELDASAEFISNGNIFTSIKYEDAGGKFGHLLTYNGTDTANPYVDGWTDENCKTITFLEPPTGNLLTWLNENGVKQ